MNALCRPRAPFAPSVRAFAFIAIGALLVLVAPLAARADAGRHGASSSYSYGTSNSDDGFGWALYDPSDGSTSCSTSDEVDWRDVRRLLEGERSKVLWIHLDGRDYVLRDHDLVKQADAIVAPMRELGERQGRLGQVQGELGHQQGRLGARQGRLGARQAELSLRLARLAADADRDGDRDARREVREIQREIDALSEEQNELSRQQQPLSERQGELGRQQGELGREMSRLSARVRDQLHDLAEDAVHDGRAQPVRARRPA